MSIRSSRHKVPGDKSSGYVATRRGDAIRIDAYHGRSKAKNYAFFLDATRWPRCRHDQLIMAVVLYACPTLLKGSSLTNASVAFGRHVREAEAMMKAINEVMEQYHETE